MFSFLKKHKNFVKKRLVYFKIITIFDVTTSCFLNKNKKMEGFEKKEGFEKNDREEIFSKAVRAGKRTYFFDVKATRKNDYYLTITESKKRFDQEGKYHFEKHKIFLYKEDFDKFADGLKEVVGYIKDHQGEALLVPELEEAVPAAEYTNVEFEDLSE